MTTVNASVLFKSATTSESVECQVLRGSIAHGRDDPTTQPVASTCVLELIGDLPALAVIGTRVEARATVVTARPHSFVRFVGEITDIKVAWDSVSLTKPQIIAAGYIGRMGRRLVGATPYPSELDGARVNRAITDAAVPTDPFLTDPGTVNVLARDVDRRAALDVAHDAAEDGGGILWEDRNGRVLYADTEHRRNAPISATLDACDVSVGLEWQQSLEGLINDIYIRYGLPIAEYHASDADMVAQYGVYGGSLSTRLQDEADAIKRADIIIARQARPIWVVSGVEVNLNFLTENEASALINVDVHSLIKLINLPATSPVSEALLWVEGVRETIEPDSWLFSMAVSDYCRTAGATRWNDLPQSLTWDTLDPNMTWNEVSCIAPDPVGGAWDTTDPALRWDTVSSNVLWDQWGTGPSAP